MLIYHHALRLSHKCASRHLLLHFVHMTCASDNIKKNPDWCIESSEKYLCPSAKPIQIKAKAHDSYSIFIYKRTLFYSSAFVLFVLGVIRRYAAAQSLSWANIFHVLFCFFIMVLWLSRSFYWCVYTLEFQFVERIATRWLRHYSSSSTVPHTHTVMR